MRVKDIEEARNEFAGNPKEQEIKVENIPFFKFNLVSLNENEIIGYIWAAFSVAHFHISLYGKGLNSIKYIWNCFLYSFLNSYDNEKFLRLIESK